MKNSNIKFLYNKCDFYGIYNYDCEKQDDILNIRSRVESIFDGVPGDARDVIDFQKVEFIVHSFTHEYCR